MVDLILLTMNKHKGHDCVHVLLLDTTTYTQHVPKQVSEKINVCTQQDQTLKT